MSRQDADVSMRDVYGKPEYYSDTMVVDGIAHVFESIRYCSQDGYMYHSSDVGAVETAVATEIAQNQQFGPQGYRLMRVVSKTHSSDFARSIGVSEDLVKQWESGDAEPEPWQQQAYAVLLVP